MIGGSARRSAMATSIISMRQASCRRRTSFAPSPASRSWTNWRPAIPPHRRNMKFRCGSISPAISRCAFMGSTSSTPILTWCARAGWFRPLVRRWGIRPFPSRRCYKLVSLIHTNRAGEFFIYAGLRVVSGKDHECPLLYELIDDFVRSHGRGIIKRLILDRGFIDGPSIGRCQRDHHIDVLIPAKTNMDIYKDAVGLAQAGALQFQTWSPPTPAPKPIPVHRPEAVRKREEKRQRTLAQRRAEMPPPAPDPKKTLVRSEVAAIPALETFSTCPVPIHAVLNRETYSDGHCDYWMLLDTKPIVSAADIRNEYGLRPVIEERHRQLKCFSGIDDFSSRAFSLVVNQVTFVLLTYSLLQWYLLRTERKPLNPKTPTRILDLLRPVFSVIVIYYQNYVAFLDPLEYQEMVLTLSETARKKILAKTRKLRRGLANQLQKPRAP